MKMFLQNAVAFSSGKIDLSYIDPVIIGRGLFRVTNNFMSEVVGFIQTVLCLLVDSILDVVKGIYLHVNAI